MTKEDCVNGLKHMAAYKSLSLQHIGKFGLKGESHTPENPSPFVTVETAQLEVLKSAIFHLSGEEFVPPTL